MRVQHFGEITLDRAERRLERRAKEIEVQPLVFRAIVFLADHPERVLSKDELFSELWPDRVVGDAALARLIKEARSALGDDASDPRYIRTVPRVGYQWIAAEESPSPGLPGKASSSKGRGVMLAMATALLIVSAAAWLWTRGESSGPVSTDRSLAPDVTEIQARRYYEQGRAALRVRDRDEIRRAAELFEQALVVDPGFGPAMAGLAVARLIQVNVPQSDLEEARGLLERALEIDPSDSLTHAGLGLLALGSPERWDEAERHLRRALELDPDDGDALNWLAMLVGNQGRVRESVALRREALYRDPTHTGLAGNLAGGLVALGRFEEARDLIEPLAEAPENRRSLRYPRQLIALAIGRPDEALEITLEVLAQHPTSIDIHAEALRLLALLAFTDDVDSIYRSVRPCIQPRALAWADLEHAFFLGERSGIATAAAPFLDNLGRIPPFALTSTAVAALVLDEPELADQLMRRRFPDAAAIRGEQGNVLTVLELALLAIEAARRVEDTTRVQAMAGAVVELAGQLRENGVRRSSGLSVVEAQAASALGDHAMAADRLAQAVDEGFWDWMTIRQGPTWTLLRQNSEYASLLAEVERRHTSLRESVAEAPWYPGADGWPNGCSAPAGE